MKKYITSDIRSTTVGSPIYRGTMDFLQYAHQETTDRLSHKLIVDKLGAPYATQSAYILYGCDQNIVSSTLTFNSGVIYWNGELFDVNTSSVAYPGTHGTTFSYTGNVTITNYTNFADPVTFTDQSVHNIHNQRTITFLNATASTGSGFAFNYTDLNYLNYPQSFNNAWIGSSITINIDRDRFYDCGNPPNGLCNIFISPTNYKLGAEITLFGSSIHIGTTVSVGIGGSGQIGLLNAASLGGSTGNFIIRLKVINDISFGAPYVTCEMFYVI